MKPTKERKKDKTYLKQTLRWRKWVTIAFMIFLGAYGGGTVVGWYLIQTKLIPLIEVELGKYLDRPINIGKLQGLSLISARFGPSKLPATTDNPDRAEIDAVGVRFNLLPFLLTKTLPLEVDLIRPDLYIEQDHTGLWTPTNFGTEDSEGGIKVNVKTINLKQADVTLVARQPETKQLNPPVLAKFNAGKVNFVNNGDVIQFKVQGKLKQGGKLNITGEAIDNIIDLVVDGKKLAAKEIENLLALPIALDEGTINGKIGVKLTGAPIPELDGRAKLNDIALRVPGLTNSFRKSNGQLYFAGSEIRLDRVKSQFGEVPATAKGTIDIAGQGKFALNATFKPIDSNKVLKALELESPVPLKGKIKGDIAMTGIFVNPLIEVEIASTTPTRIDQLDFKKVQGNLALQGNDLLVQDFTGIPQAGGQIQGQGLIKLDESQEVRLNVEGTNLVSEAIAKSYNTQLPIEMGLATGSAQITFAADDLSTFKISNGQGNFVLGEGLVTLNNLNYQNRQWRSQILASEVRFDSLPFGKDMPSTIGAGLVNGSFTATGEINDPELQTVIAEGTATVNTQGGIILAPQINLASGIWRGDFTTNQINLRKLFPEIPTEFNDQIEGNFFLTGKVTVEPGQDTTITGEGNLQLAAGTVRLSDLIVTGNDWSAIADAEDLELKQLNSTTPDQFAGLVNGNFQVSGTVDNITPEGIIATGDGSLTLPEGVFDASNLALADGNFKTTVIPQGVDLSLFADPNSDDFILEGNLTGELKVTGQVDKIDPTAVSAQGKVTFSKGIDLLGEAFTANILWDGARLDVLQATGNRLDAKGFIELDPTFFDNIPDKLAAVNYFKFDVNRANWLDVNRLKLSLPSWAVNLNRSGRFDFSGKLSGTPAVMDIDGDLTLRNFAVEYLTFAENLIGKVRVDPNSGVDLDLREVGSVNNQQIQLKLDRNFLPQFFSLQHQEISVIGRGKQEIVTAQVTNVPLELLKIIAIKSPDFTIPENLAVQSLLGKISGSITTNLNTLETSGENVVITSPAFGRIAGNKLVGNFAYANDYLALQDVEFRQGSSLYKLTADIVQNEDDLDVNGAISVDQGDIQDVLVALEIFELRDLGNLSGDRKNRKYGDFQDLTLDGSPLAIGQNSNSIWRQMQLLSATQAWLDITEQQRQESSLLPELKDLKGNFSGNIEISGSLNQGIGAEFLFQGEKWQWEKLQNGEPTEDSTIAEKLTLKGDFKNNILTILPLTIDFPNKSQLVASNGEMVQPQLIITGSMGGENLSGRLALRSIPIELIEQLVTLPPEIAFGGIIDAEANIIGTRENPKGKGELNIRDATINQTSIESAEASFNYNNALLTFNASSVVAQASEPLTIDGSIPYKLPFASTEPQSDLITASLNVKDRGLTLINILTRGEVNWLSGEGAVALELRGNFDQTTNQASGLTAEGKVTINQGQIAVRSLPDEFLTDVNSEINVDLDRIAVESFIGNFGGGKISAAGTIPLTRNVPQENPLTINLDDVVIDLKGLYQGGVQGKLKILGTATEPDITGAITLQDGLFLLSSDATVPIEADLLEEQGLPAVTEYKNLQLQLGKNIKISQPPILSFVATGTLDLEGTFLQPLPEGTINLERGQVNLFTSQLNLARGEENTARFIRNDGLDPLLNINLVGSAIETTQSRATRDPLSTEIEENLTYSLGTIDTVRISAKVQGLASQIANNIELTSSPPRSQTQILSLLGGGFVDTLGRGNSTLGLANLAGSALFGSLTSEFNNVFPPGEIRLFPTQIIDEDQERRRDALAGELAINVTKRFSFSVIQVLNVGGIPPQVGVRYRLNENFVLRGSSNFNKESRTVLEYELKF
ncbi:MAG: translocation/assembly module TamB domain-containing protein [Xenococcus sp. MO_188.B8]|nr:translocation/assembly module TamB domain-containing protein [Xenococcus sp. MO_188.B8]